MTLPKVICCNFTLYYTLKNDIFSNCPGMDGYLVGPADLMLPWHCGLSYMVLLDSLIMS